MEYNPSGNGNRVKAVESMFMGSLMYASKMSVLFDFETATCGVERD